MLAYTKTIDTKTIILQNGNFVFEKINIYKNNVSRVHG